MEFIDESEAFTNGFECGQIWERIKNDERVEGHLIHLENSAQIQMICDHYKVKCEIKQTSEEWAELTIN